MLENNMGDLVFFWKTKRNNKCQNKFFFDPTIYNFLHRGGKHLILPAIFKLLIAKMKESQKVTAYSSVLSKHSHI